MITGFVLAATFGLGQSAIAAPNYPEDHALQANIQSDFAAEAELARRGDPEAQYYLSSMYREGRGTSRSARLALIWLRMSAEAGWAKAQTGLGFRYRIGEGVRQSDQLAARWFKRAAVQKDYVATIEIAGMYRDGRGVSKDIKRALHWYSNVADADGAVLARSRFAEVCGSYSCPSADRAAAYKYLTMDSRLRFSGSDEAHRADLLHKLASGMTSEQIDASERLAYAWQTKHPLALPVL